MLSGAAVQSGAQQTEFNAAVAAPTGAVLGSAFVKTTSAIPDSAATAVATLSVPNAEVSAVFRVLVRSAIIAAGHNFNSTRVVEYFGTITRHAGGAAVVALSAAVGAQIATLGGGAQTLTTALAVAAAVGGVGATQTFDLQITNAVSVAGLTETTVSITILNGNTNLATVS